VPRIPPPRADGYTQSTTVPLYWASHGRAGAPKILLLHGGPGAHHDYLLPQMLDLARDHELIFYDQRGGGRSRVDGREPITWRTHVDDLTAVVTEITRPGPSIVGYSWGGLLAMLHLVHAANDETQRPARLVLIDPAPITRQFRSRFEAEFARRQASPGVAAMREELAASGLRERDPERYRHRAFELSVAGYFADPAAAKDLTPFRVIGRVQQSVWESLGDFDLTDDLRRVAPAPPVLVVHGREDPIPLESSEEVAGVLGARLVVIEGSGHVPYVEQPGTLFPAVREFLTETAHLARG
jgi:proline iminopeptidase